MSRYDMCDLCVDSNLNLDGEWPSHHLTPELILFIIIIIIIIIISTLFSSAIFKRDKINFEQLWIKLWLEQSKGWKTLHAPCPIIMMMITMRNKTFSTTLTN